MVAAEGAQQKNPDEIELSAGGLFKAFTAKMSDILTAISDSSPVRYVVNWGRLYSLWPVHITTACCSAEFGAMMGPRYDPERFGIQMVAGSLRQCDLLVVEGTVTKKMASRLKVVYDQMPEPKYVIAMGDCACSGGLFYNSYSTLPLDALIPVDVYLPGCPPNPQALLDAILKLQEKIRKGKVNPLRIEPLAQS